MINPNFQKYNKYIHEVITIRVVSSYGVLWYADKVGATFEVFINDKGDYQLIESTNGILHFIVRKEHGIRIKTFSGRY